MTERWLVPGDIDLSKTSRLYIATYRGNIAADLDEPLVTSFTVPTAYEYLRLMWTEKEESMEELLKSRRYVGMSRFSINDSTPYGGEL